eukprot:scaffold59154_cov31-Tisochrysis_lutea.AAC.1
MDMTKRVKSALSEGVSHRADHFSMRIRLPAGVELIVFTRDSPALAAAIWRYKTTIGKLASSTNLANKMLYKSTRLLYTCQRFYSLQLEQLE